MTDNRGDDVMARTAPLILVADDDEDILELVRLRLGRCGYETVLARDGAEALEAARTRQPDLAMLDVSMPFMDGYAVTQALRSDPTTKDMPVILLTARATTADVALGFEAGADDYITKPFSPQALQSRVAAVLDRAAAANVAAAPAYIIRPASADA
jgi:DNA-binding response OmpR family regulator